MLAVLLLSAIAGTRSVAAENPLYADAYQAGQNYAEAGTFAEARAEFEKALTVEGINPDQTALALIEIGASYIRERKVQDGMVSIRKARALEGISNPTSIKANLLFGQTYLAYPWVLDQARDAFTQVLELPEITSEQKLSAQKGMVKALMGLRQFADARAMMTTLAANTDLPPAEKLATQISIGEACLLEEIYPEARTELLKALSMQGLSESDKANIQLQIGLSYYEAKDDKHAKLELEKVLTMPGANTTQVRVDGWDNYTPAREARLRLLKMNPADEKEKTLAVLFIGSSLTLRGYMHYLIEQLASSAPAGRPRIISGQHLRGGTGIEVFWEEGDTRRDTARGKMAAVPWDVVVVETSSLRPAASNLKYGKLFCDLARNKGIKPVIYESHIKRDESYPDAHQKYHDHEVVLGKTTQSPLAPVVLAEMYYLQANPKAQIGTFYADWIHPSQKGTYLAAYCIYSAITGYSPVGLSHPQSISDEDARALQEAAWKAVQETNPAVSAEK